MKWSNIVGLSAVVLVISVVAVQVIAWHFILGLSLFSYFGVVIRGVCQSRDRPATATDLLILGGDIV
jgi:hypothetical protein